MRPIRYFAAAILCIIGMLGDSDGRNDSIFHVQMKLKDAKLLNKGDALYMTKYGLAQGLQGPRDARTGNLVGITKDGLLLRIKRPEFGKIGTWSPSFWEALQE